jgi:hypothetical protein
MKNNIAAIRLARSLRDQYYAVESDLLMPVDHSNRQWLALASVYLATTDVSVSTPLFREALPLRIVRFRPEAAQSIRAEAETLPAVSNSPPLANRFCDEMQKYHKAIFTRTSSLVYIPLARLGLWKKPRSPDLHPDTVPDPDDANLNVAYLARLGGLKLEAIKGGRLATATEEEKQYIESAKYPRGNKARLARQWLRRKNILRSFPLDYVALIEVGPNGTLHGSARIPRGGASSVFLAASGFVYCPNRGIISPSP